MTRGARGLLVAVSRWRARVIVLGAFTALLAVGAVLVLAIATDREPSRGRTPLRTLQRPAVTRALRSAERADATVVESASNSLNREAVLLQRKGANPENAASSDASSQVPNAGIKAPRLSLRASVDPPVALRGLPVQLALELRAEGYVPDPSGYGPGLSARTYVRQMKPDAPWVAIRRDTPTYHGGGLGSSFVRVPTTSPASTPSEGAVANGCAAQSWECRLALHISKVAPEYDDNGNRILSEEEKAEREKSGRGWAGPKYFLRPIRTDFPLWEAGKYEAKAHVSVGFRLNGAGDGYLDGSEVDSNVVEIEIVPPPAQDERALEELRALRVFGLAEGERGYDIGGLVRFLERHGQSVYAPYVTLESARRGDIPREARLASLSRVMADYPHFEHNDQALLLLGQFAENDGLAATCYREVLARYPASKSAAEARKRLDYLDRAANFEREAELWAKTHPRDPSSSSNDGE